MSEEQANYKAKGKTIFRTIKNEDHPFVMIDRRPVENPELSWGAKGVLSYILSRPDNWTVRLQDLVNRSSDGVYKIRGYLKELTNAGHVHRRAERDPKTKKIIQYVLEVYELPFTKPLTNLPQAGLPHAENLTLNNNESLTDNEFKDGADAPLPLDWQIAGNQEHLVVDDRKAQMVDAANLIATGMGSMAEEAYRISLTFQESRNIVISGEQVKGQRKAVKLLIQSHVKPENVSQAVQKLITSGMTVTDLFSVVRTAIDLANPAPQPVSEYEQL